MYNLMAELENFYPENPTIRNTNKYAYNCGGYATGCFHWYLPYDSYETFEALEKSINRGEIKTATDFMVNYIKKDFGYKDIFPHQIEKLYKTHEIIAFRISTNVEYLDWDFHFVKLGKNKSWYEKLGSSQKIERHSFDWVFSVWHQRYDSQIYFLAKERP